MQPAIKRLLIVNQDVGYLFIDLSNAALEHYDEVVLMSGSVIELGGQLDPRVQIQRMVRYERRSTLSRLLSWAAGFLQVIWCIGIKFRKSEIIAASNPPLNTLLSIFCSNRKGLYVLDLYPEALYKTGMLAERNLIVRLWRGLNRSAYRGFDVIWALTPSMRTTIENEYNVKVELAPAWASKTDVEPDDEFLASEGLSGSWIVLYSGNLGREHEIESILVCAEALSIYEDIVFVIAGEGWKKETLMRFAKKKKLSNVKFLPKLPSAKFLALLANTRIGVVSQSLRTADVCIPSKTFNLLAMGLPILGIGQPESDFGDLIGESRAGRVFLPEQVAEMSEFIATCFNDNEVLTEYGLGAMNAAESYTGANGERVVAQFSEHGRDV